jgi:ABC-type glycerol-3-phosphate transport system substrate-binding protein
MLWAMHAEGHSLGSVSRRVAVGALAAGGVGFALLGPRGAKESTGSRLVLDYWEKWSGHEALAMQKVVDAFNASQDRIFVRFFTMTGIDQKAMVAIAGGDPPDVIGLYSRSIPTFAESGAIEPLDQIASAAGVRGSEYAAPVWELMKFRGEVWGLPNTCSTIGLYYNRTMFREAGLDPDRPPRSIEELDEFADRLTQRDGEGRITRIGFVQTEPGWWPHVWAPTFGGKWYDEEHDRATPTDPRVVRGYEWVQSYPAKYGIERLRSFGAGLGNYDSPLQPLLGGRVAISMHGPFLVNVIQRYKPDFDYGAAAFPMPADVADPSRPAGLLESDVLVIPRGCKRPEASMEFVAFTQRREWVEFMARTHCKPSPLAESSAAFLKEHPHRNIGVHEAIARSPRAFATPKTRLWNEYDEEVRSAFSRMWDQGLPAAAVLGAIDVRINQSLDLARERRARRQVGRAS